MPELTLAALAPETASLPALAPENLTQFINPFQLFANLTAVRIGELHVYMGDSTRPDVEKEILRSVGSYGRQIGQMADALQVLLRHVDRTKFSPEEAAVISVFEGQIAKVDLVKKQAGVTPALALAAPAKTSPAKTSPAKTSPAKT